MGTTSACAENTNHHGHSRQYPRNYLRVRGEYQSSGHAAGTMGELPPRARRIPLLAHLGAWAEGTTSACAENTGLRAANRYPKGNYLRVRGEYCSIIISAIFTGELPPRARRIRLAKVRNCGGSGTTSACAENTRPGVRPDYRARNYLRVRGEYPGRSHDLDPTWELPPRARRILFCNRKCFAEPGTTSACAENTTLCGGDPYSHWNYLRVRGEYFLRSS